MRQLLSMISAALIAACATGTTWATDLVASGAKPVTIQSEIDRGMNSLNTLSPSRISPHDFRASVENIAHSNEQKNTDSKGFLFGLYYVAWHRLWLSLSSGIYTHNRVDLETSIQFMRTFSEYAQALRNRLGLSQEELRKVAGAWYSEDEENAFPALLESRKFKDSYHGGK